MNLDPVDYLQLQQAAHGCVSGTLAEWPWLEIALQRSGVQTDKTMPANVLRELSKLVLQRNEALQAVEMLRDAPYA